MELAGKSAVVTGGATGIGRGMALALAAAGTNVVIADIDEENGRATCEEASSRGVRSAFLATDVRDSRQMTALADFAWETLGRVDILCGNAGVVAAAPGIEISDDDFRWQWEVNVVGVFNGLREFTRRFLEQGGEACILNTGSHLSVAAPNPGIASYVACKHAILGLTDAFRREYGDRISYGVLCPGIVNTEMWDSGRNRPPEFGGPYKGDPHNQEVLEAFGLRPERVGEIAVEGIRKDMFLIWTHPQDLALVEARYRACRDTLLDQWPNGPDDEQKTFSP